MFMRNRMKELRARDNITQAELANLVGVRRETIVFLEKGKYNPSLSLAYAVAQVFNLTIEEVFIFEPSDLEKITTN
ncbi:MAG: helix-turn-helix transcriptional regulator [Anaerolineales bacterium]